MEAFKWGPTSAIVACLWDRVAGSRGSKGREAFPVGEFFRRTILCRAAVNDRVR